MSGKALTRVVFPVVELVLTGAAVISVMRGDFGWAAWGISLAAVLYLVDVPRMEPTLETVGPSQTVKIGVSMLCFGVAPAFVAHEAYLREEPWGWALAGLYALAAGVGVARTRVEPDRRSKPMTPGLPPAASAVVLVASHPFFTTSAVAPWLGGLPSAQEAGGVMICLLILMLSPVPYPVTPRISLRRGQRRAAALFILGGIVAALVPDTIVFPAFVFYTFWGVAESVTPVLAEGILEETNEVGRSGLEGDAEDTTPPSRGYRARSTWE